MFYLSAILTVACLLLAIAAWLALSVRKLSQMHKNALLAYEQHALYNRLCSDIQSDLAEHRRIDQLDSSKTIYQKAAADYNRTLVSAKNRLPSRLWGFMPSEFNVAASDGQEQSAKIYYWYESLSSSDFYTKPSKQKGAMKR